MCEVLLNVGQTQGQGCSKWKRQRQSEKAKSAFLGEYLTINVMKIFSDIGFVCSNIYAFR